MKNLARRNPTPEQLAEINQCVKTELEIAGIFSIPNFPDDRGEVPAEFSGKYKGFKFKRLWYYWAVDGFVPLEVAEEIYSHPVGNQDVRANGDCGCVSPNDCFSEYDLESERCVTTDKEYDDGIKLLKKYPIGSARWIQEYIPLSQVKNNPKKFISSYHIDSQEGLNLFMNIIQKYKLTGRLN